MSGLFSLALRLVSLIVEPETNIENSVRTSSYLSLQINNKYTSHSNVRDGILRYGHQAESFIRFHAAQTQNGLERNNKLVSHVTAGKLHTFRV